jgi:hypothetical protein
MLKARVSQVEKQAREDFRYSESLLAMLVPFMWKEEAEKEATKKEADVKDAAKKEAAEKEAAEKETTENDEYQWAWPSRSSDDNGPVSPIRFPRVKHWFKCLAFGTDFCWMMVVYMFIFSLWILMNHISNRLEFITVPVATEITKAMVT